MKEFKTNKISKKEFLKLSEDNVLFITNPGRMGDEDGSTFVIKDGNQLTIYRIDGWMYPRNGQKEDEIISLDDMVKQFPNWFQAWKNGENKNFDGKYTYLYMGFGNGLCVDNSIYDIFEPYLNKLVEDYLQESSEEEKYNVRFRVWKKALINMIEDKKYKLGE